MKLNESVALITGGASGLGRATAEALAARGVRIVLFDLDQGVAEAASEIGGDAIGVRGSVTDAADVEAALEAAAQRWPRLDVAVNCAGVVTPGRVLQRGAPLDLERFRSVIEVNLIGTFNVLRLAAARMAAQEPRDDERGVIVNTASTAAYEAQIGQPAYAASKGGVVSLTMQVARDLAAQLIRCAAIAPGVFETPMMGSMPDDVRQSLAENVPHPRRFGRPSEFGALVAHIIENPMLNGEVVRLDGAARMPPR
jgi:NAD(P)-dependent dehydrogenase (short-subunit alcohol dehydrogenase family)